MGSRRKEAPGSGIELEDVLVNPTRAAAFEVLERMGVEVVRANPRHTGGEGLLSIGGAGGAA